MPKRTINRQQLLLEFVSIVFAVLLALLLNTWREALAQERQLTRVKQVVQKEVEQNDEVVRKSMEYRIQLVSDLVNKTHLMNAIPVEALPVDVENDAALEQLMQKEFNVSSSRYYETIKIIRSGNRRSLVLNEHIFRLAVEQDTLKLYGPGNIQLRTAGISNRFWDIAQATGAIVSMELDLVDALSKVHNLNQEYLNTADDAIEMIYQGKPGIVSVLQDMVFYEGQILKADSVVLSLLD